MRYPVPVSRTTGRRPCHASKPLTSRPIHHRAHPSRPSPSIGPHKRRSAATSPPSSCPPTAERRVRTPLLNPDRVRPPCRVDRASSSQLLRRHPRRHERRPPLLRSLASRQCSQVSRLVIPPSRHLCSPLLLFRSRRRCCLGGDLARARRG